MNLLIVSDIHGNYLNMKKVLQNEALNEFSFDYLLILGDILSGPFIEGYDPDKLSKLLNSYKDKIIAVRGNCDSDISSLDFLINEYYTVFPVDNKKLLLTHGHIYNKNHSPEVEFDALLNGHTHIPVMEKSNNKYYLNPGSITLPKGGSTKSYMCYVDDVFYLKDLETNEVIKKIVMYEEKDS